jgi:porin
VRSISAVPLAFVLLLAQAAAQDARAPQPGVRVQESPAAEAGNGGAQAANEKSDKSAESQKSSKKSAAKQDKEEEHKPADPDTGTSTVTEETLGVLPNVFDEVGVKFSLSYVGEALGNVAGGFRRGAIYEGRLNAAIDLDLQKLAQLSGLSFHANVFQEHGPGLSRNYVGNLLTLSSLEALATTRLYEAWVEQKFFRDKWSIRAGQLAADTEFITTRFSDVFINSTFGWPGINALDLPSGGPSPPLAAVGARLKAELSDKVTVLAAVFDGDPAGPGPDDPQSRNRYGVNFRVNDPPFGIAELQYAYNLEKNAPGLPGTVKLGGWYHAGLFNDQRVSANGLSLADPNAAPVPAQLRGDHGLYAVFEQQIAQFSKEDDARGIGLFVRVAQAPSDRNLVDFYADGGISVIGLWPERPHDKIGLGFAYARISDSARALDRDFQVLAQSNRPVRDHEALLGLSYLAEVRTGWTMHPTLQYVMHPGGGYVSPAGIPTPVRNAVVLGVRTVLKF